MDYHHTQNAPLGWLLLCFAGLQLALAWVARGQPPVSLILLASGFVIGILASMFWSLTIRNDGEFLVVRFGPLGVFGTRIPFANITAVECGRSSLIDGWGIHCVPGRGWTFNLWGFACVKLTVNGKTIRIGSNDAQRLTEYVRQRTAAPR